MGFCDFVVKYDPEVDTSRDLFLKILYSIWSKTLKSNKPVNIGLFGSSGNGKSWGGIELVDALFEIEGLDMFDFFEWVNIYTPLQYSEKIDKLLFDKSLKKVKWVIFHEARELIKANDWQNFLSQAVNDVNAMARTIKRMGTFIISQDISDITKSMRKTLNYYCEISRPRGKRPRLKIYVMWHDNRDLENPKLRKRRLNGYLVMPDGRYKQFRPDYFELEKPRKELVDLFEAQDFSAKSVILKGKLDDLLKRMRSDLNVKSDKINIMVDWYMKDLDNISNIGKMYRGRWKLKPDVAKMHELTSFELDNFEKKLNERMLKEGIIGVENE